jgi:threonine dehydrogenase-like Zn-dependent dehydrogenase
MADAFIAPASRFHVIPDSLSDAQAALVEPLSTAVHAVRMAGPLPGAAVAVLGGGTIGLLTLTAAVRAGARAVAVSEPRDNKRQRALRLGAAFCAGPLAADPVPALRDALGGMPTSPSTASPPRLPWRRPSGWPRTAGRSW